MSRFDAMGCHSNIAEIIVDQGADYLLQLKENQKSLYDDTCLLFDDLEQKLALLRMPMIQTKPPRKEHGRIEIRQAWTISNPSLLQNLHNADHFKNLQTVMKVRLI